MNGDIHVQFCEQRWGKFLALTHRVICFQYEVDAHKVMTVLPKRLAKYNLSLNFGKTKLSTFSKTKQKENIRQETFDFLGFSVPQNTYDRSATMH